MSRPEIVFPRQNPGRRIIGNGDIVLSELSTSFDGYPGQIHRPMVFGEPTPEYQRLFNISRDAFYKVLEVLKPGNSNHDVSAAAGSIFEPAGVYTQDVLIHGWGLSLENPLLDYTPRALIANEQQSLVFEPGMTFVLQPHVLSEDRQRGLQIGSSVVITDDGAEVLQKYPIEWITIAG